MESGDVLLDDRSGQIGVIEGGAKGQELSFDRCPCVGEVSESVVGVVLVDRGFDLADGGFFGGVDHRRDHLVERSLHGWR